MQTCFRTTNVHQIEVVSALMAISRC